MTDNAKEGLPFLNRERYVKVTDLKIGKSGAYTDYEEMALREGDPDWFATLENVVVDTCWDPNNTDQENQDLCDLVFYNSIHVLYWWHSTDVTITEDLCRMAVESCWHMVLEVLTCEWVIRSDKKWQAPWREKS